MMLRRVDLLIFVSSLRIVNIPAWQSGFYTFWVQKVPKLRTLPDTSGTCNLRNRKDISYNKCEEHYKIFEKKIVISWRFDFCKENPNHPLGTPLLSPPK